MGRALRRIGRAVGRAVGWVLQGWLVLMFAGLVLSIPVAIVSNVVGNSTSDGPSIPHNPPRRCDGGYTNSAGVCVSSPSPERRQGATALCRDGTYSYSKSRSGTCSHHGGVAVWL